MSRLIKYLKPNFSNYWGNWFLAPLIAFFVGFLPSAAFSNPDEYQEGVYYRAKVYNDYHYGATPSAVCASAPSSIWATNGQKVGCVLVSLDYEGQYAVRYDRPEPYQDSDYRISRHSCGSSTAEYCQPTPEPECPETGTAGFINVPLTYGSTLPEYYSVDGCKFAVVEFACENTTQHTLENCSVSGEYTGEQIDSGQSPTDPGDKPQKRCHYPDGSVTQEVDYDAPCPDGSTEDPPGDPDTGTDPETDPGTDGGDGGTDGGDDGGDGGECDPTVEQCPTEPETDPEPDQEQGTPGNGVADMGSSDMAQFCRDNPKAAQCSEYVHSSPEKGSFDLAALDDEIDQKWSQLDAVIQSTKSSIKQKFSLSVSSGGGLPCFPFVTWNGVTEEVCLSNYSDAFSKLAAAVLFICIVIGILIILR